MHSNSESSRRGPDQGAERLAPTQARSRATRDRILSSLVRLLSTKPFDQVSVAELTDAAGCSMSSFYARFPTKAALLVAFLDLFFQVSAGDVGKTLSRIAEDHDDAEARARAWIGFVLQSYRAHRGLLRSLILHDRLHPDAGFGERSRRHKQEVATAVVSLLSPPRPRPSQKARTRVSLALWLVTQAIEQIVLFADPIVEHEGLSDPMLIDELTAVLIRAMDDPPRRRTRRGGGRE